MPDRGNSLPKGTEAENCKGAEKGAREEWGGEPEARIFKGSWVPLRQAHWLLGSLEKSLEGIR